MTKSYIVFKVESAPSKTWTKNDKFNRKNNGINDMASIFKDHLYI